MTKQFYLRQKIKAKKKTQAKKREDLQMWSKIKFFYLEKSTVFKIEFLKVQKSCIVEDWARNLSRTNTEKHK